MEIQMDQLQAWFRMVTYLIDGQARQWSGTLYPNMIISLKVFLFLVLLENCNLYN